MSYAGPNLTGKTWSADHDHLGQNDRDRPLKLNMMLNLVGTMHLVLRPIANCGIDPLALVQNPG